jgi:26S proteasome regulatory subunit T2
MIFGIHVKRMSLATDVNLEEVSCCCRVFSCSDVLQFVMSKDELSGADIKAICTEAGLLALRERRMVVKQADFVAAKEKVLYRKQDKVPVGMYL